MGRSEGAGDWLRVAAGVCEARAAGRPVVALESALITHGLPMPLNLEVARQLERVVREEGAVPATIAVLDGVAHAGLSQAELERLAREPDPEKISLRDLPAVLATGRTGGTTVAASMHLAYRAGIDVFATGGIGGVHRGHAEDVSADLRALGSVPLVVVCAGAKAILDLPGTLERLETLGVPVVGYGTDTFPAFTSCSSGLPVSMRVESPQAVAAVAQARDDAGLGTAILVAVPIPAPAGLPWSEAEAEIAAVVAQAEAEGVGGRDLTPFLLARLSERTGGRSLEANRALLVNNARVAARIAAALAARGGQG
jgi:pseudouridine-5'-phosphate glycosidase